MQPVPSINSIMQFSNRSGPTEHAEEQLWDFQDDKAAEPMLRESWGQQGKLA